MEKFMSVQVKETFIRMSSSFIAKIKGKLLYGDQVAVIEENDAWIKIKAFNSNITGWMHSSALTVKKIILKPGEKDVKLAANSDEYALAGKGFNKDVEKEYKKKNPNLNFAWVDKMESFKVSSRQIQQFQRKGKLVPQGGA
ncbi:MAG: SH3 domain-containing protein [Desulfobacula sp.]|jgi:hypothetical protein|uniref:SH3 domain-containing protein n=1 Tax=Desulfobacula sp. TaxID=2593537 RepID=UPI001D35AED9|nr:SH3 domain-containing protein [Desulfobacula sp.]MBT3487387.1 SH3 domain-containing protein [Desulfobacula sp.]MBT3804341.1 SH3 domain-containing protein [Desulfobacula sp.]MBT4026861.1 SH3 domain-containing protein [Desulfobacula sp.]MBT4198534.1 SH3 domain-containing protein [Desulfobacula sp.]